MTNNAVIYIVDDDATLRGMLEMMVSSAGYQAISFANPETFLAQYQDQHGCLLLDIRMPEMSGLEVQDQLIRDDALMPVIFITGHGDIAMAVDCLHKGAFDFIEKPFREKHLLDKVQQALESDLSTRQLAAQRQAILERIHTLTPREHEVMQLITQGLANKVIAIDLDIAQGTVEIHRSRVMQKMGVRSVAQLTRLVMLAQMPNRSR